MILGLSMIFGLRTTYGLRTIFGLSLTLGFWVLSGHSGILDQLARRCHSTTGGGAAVGRARQRR